MAGALGPEGGSHIASHQPLIVVCDEPLLECQTPLLGGPERPSRVERFLEGSDEAPVDPSALRCRDGSPRNRKPDGLKIVAHILTAIIMPLLQPCLETNRECPELTADALADRLEGVARVARRAAWRPTASTVHWSTATKTVTGPSSRVTVRATNPSPLVEGEVFIGL
jgi:hypothetical protein